MTRITWNPPGQAIDGTCWPRSDHLDVELRDLLPEVSAHLGSQVNHVSLHLGDWADQPRRLKIGGLPVRLGWFRRLATDTVTLGHGAEVRTVLHVIPSEVPS